MLISVRPQGCIASNLRVHPSQAQFYMTPETTPWKSKGILSNDVKSFSFRPSQYKREAMCNIENHLGKLDIKVSNEKPFTLFPSLYHPELDATPNIIFDENVCYQPLVGILQQIVKYATISSHHTLQRKGSLITFFCIFSYIKYPYNFRLLLDLTYLQLTYNTFPIKDWTNFMVGSNKYHLLHQHLGANDIMLFTILTLIQQGRK